jgi:hypothetical protein
MAGCNPAQYMSRFGRTQNGDRHVNDSYWLSEALLAKDSYDQGWTGGEEDEHRGQGRQEAALRQRS